MSATNLARVRGALRLQKALGQYCLPAAAYSTQLRRLSNGTPSAKTQVGVRELSSDELGQLEPTDLTASSPNSLREKLHDKGYLWVRQLHDRDTMQRACDVVLRKLDKEGVLKGDWRDGIVADDAADMPFLEGRNETTTHKDVMAVLESPRLTHLMSILLQASCFPFDFKWLRAVKRGQFTGAHCDSVYMSRGSQRLLTCWIPFRDTTVDMGTVTVLEQSHRLDSFERLRNTYGALDVEAVGLDGTGWFTADPFEVTSQFGGQWKTADFAAGDVLIFPMYTLHMSTTNVTDKVRISCDTRWNPADEPADPRYVGDSVGHSEAKFGAHATDTSTDSKDKITMHQLKQQWGFQCSS